MNGAVKMMVASGGAKAPSVQTVVFPMSADAGITNQHVDNNYGASTSLLGNGSVPLKALLRIDLSGIKSTSTIISASLKLYQAGSAAAVAFTINVYSISAANAGWVEGTKTGTAAAAGECCWAAKASDGANGVQTAWAGSVGLGTVTTDYEATLLGTVNGNRSDANGTEYAIALSSARIQGWFGVINTNYGLLIMGSNNYGLIASSNHATPAYRPTLTVTYLGFPL